METAAIYTITFLVLIGHINGIPVKENTILVKPEEHLSVQGIEEPKTLFVTPLHLDQTENAEDSPKPSEVPLIIVPVKGIYDPEIYTDKKFVKKNDPVTAITAGTRTQDDNEILVTANNIVFRPLFAYRKSSAQRRRVYSRPSYKRSYAHYYYPSYPRYY